MRPGWIAGGASSKARKKLIKAHRSSITEPVTGPDYGDLVAAQSRALGQLSREIAQAIKTSGRN